MPSPTPAPPAAARWAALRRLERRLEVPLAVAGIVWLALLVAELAIGLPGWLEAVGTALWALFLLDFAARLLIAPRRGAFLRRNWLTAVSLLVPALRVLRAVRVLRAARLLRSARGLRLLRVVGRTNRGVSTLRRVLARHRFGYVLLTTAVVVLVGGVAVSAMERETPGAPLADLATALWWAAMMVTTMGADVFPRTGEGRILALLLAVYGFAVFGYITATIAALFLERPAPRPEARPPRGGAPDREELRALRERIDRVLESTGGSAPGSGSAPPGAGPGDPAR